MPATGPSHPSAMLRQKKKKATLERRCGCQGRYKGTTWRLDLALHLVSFEKVDCASLSSEEPLLEMHLCPPSWSVAEAPTFEVHKCELCIDTKTNIRRYHHQQAELHNNPFSREVVVVSFLSFLRSKSTLPPSVLQWEGASQRHSTSLKLTRPVKDKLGGCWGEGTTSTNSYRLHAQCHSSRRIWLRNLKS